MIENRLPVLMLCVVACGSPRYADTVNGFRVGVEDCATVELEREVRGSLDRNSSQIHLADGNHRFVCFGIHASAALDLIIRAEGDLFRPKLILSRETQGRRVSVVEAEAATVDESARTQVTLRSGKYTLVLTTVDSETGGEFRLLVYAP